MPCGWINFLWVSMYCMCTTFVICVFNMCRLFSGIRHREIGGLRPMLVDKPYVYVFASSNQQFCIACQLFNLTLHCKFIVQLDVTFKFMYICCSLNRYVIEYILDASPLRQYYSIVESLVSVTVDAFTRNWLPFEIVICIT